MLSVPFKQNSSPRASVSTTVCYPTQTSPCSVGNNVMLRGRMETIVLCHRGMRLRIGRRRLTNHIWLMHPHSAKQSCWAWSPSAPSTESLVSSLSASLDPILKNSCCCTPAARRHRILHNIVQSASRAVALSLSIYLYLCACLLFCLPFVCPGPILYITATAHIHTILGRNSA